MPVLTITEMHTTSCSPADVPGLLVIRRDANMERGADLMAVRPRIAIYSGDDGSALGLVCWASTGDLRHRKRRARLMHEIAPPPWGRRARARATTCAFPPSTRLLSSRIDP